MAEIKSTIDLVMERTKGLKLTSEEKRALEAEEERKAAQALARRFLIGEVSMDELVKKAQDSDEDFRVELMQAFVQRLQLGNQEFFSSLEALEKTSGKALRPIINRIKDLSMHFGQALHKQRKKVKAQLWEELGRRGISGSAVEPNVEASPLWERTVQQVAREFSDRLETLKEDLLSKIR